jgi:cytochrome c-type biogenesis protein CcmE
VKASREQKQRRLLLVVALFVGLGALGGLYFFARDNLVYFWTPTDLQAAMEEGDVSGATVRLGALVKAESLVWDQEAQDIQFVATDGDNEVPVHATGAPPAMFREGIGVVVEGKMGRDGVFQSDRLMVKHSNEYRAPAEDGEDPMSVYSTVEDL